MQHAKTRHKAQDKNPTAWTWRKDNNKKKMDFDKGNDENKKEKDSYRIHL
jgi:hypothetical protein